MQTSGPSPTQSPNITKVGHTVSEKCSGQIADAGRRTDIWIPISLPELCSDETKGCIFHNNYIKLLSVGSRQLQIIKDFAFFCV